MGNKETLAYLQKQGSNKRAYFIDPTDTVTEVLAQPLLPPLCPSAWPK